MTIWGLLDLTGWVKTTGLSVPLKDEGENDLLANGENQTYSCVLGNPNIRQMVFLPAPDSDGERLVGKATVERGETWEVACNIKTFIFGDCRVKLHNFKT